MPVQMKGPPLPHSALIGLTALKSLIYLSDFTQVFIFLYANLFKLKSASQEMSTVNIAMCSFRNYLKKGLNSLQMLAEQTRLWSGWLRSI